MSLATEQSEAPPSSRRVLAVLLVLGVALLLGGAATTVNAWRDGRQGPPLLAPPSSRDPLRAEIELKHLSLIHI